MNRLVKGSAIIGIVLSMSSIKISLAETQSEPVRKTITYRTVDGHDVLADVYCATDQELRPVIIWIHGGALIMGHRGGINADIRRLAEEKGYALVSLDYRLAPETKLPGIISDIEAAFRWIASEGAKQFHLDPNRMVVCGGSAGGYLTLVTGYRVQPKPKALVAFWGYGDLIGDWYSKPSPHKRHNSREVSRDEADQQTDGTVVSDSRQRNGNGGLIYLHCRQTGTWPKLVTGFDPKTEVDKIAPFEPVRNVSPDYPPTLLIHGTKDTDVPFVQSTMMADQFKQHGVPYRLESIENGEHGLAGGNPEQIKAARAAVREFIVKHLEQE